MRCKFSRERGRLHAAACMHTHRTAHHAQRIVTRISASALGRASDAIDRPSARTTAGAPAFFAVTRMPCIAAATRLPVHGRDGVPRGRSHAARAHTRPLARSRAACCLAREGHGACDWRVLKPGSCLACGRAQTPTPQPHHPGRGQYRRHPPAVLFLRIACGRGLRTRRAGHARFLRGARLQCTPYGAFRSHRCTHTATWRANVAVRRGRGARASMGSSPRRRRAAHALLILSVREP